MTIDVFLLFALIAALGIWIGGAVSLQVLVARAQILRDSDQVITLMRQAQWIIPRVFVPLGVVGVLAGNRAGMAHRRAIHGLVDSLSARALRSAHRCWHGLFLPRIHAPQQDGYRAR